MSGIELWSATAANNTSNAGINIAENCPAGNLNNSDRQIMAAVREWYNDSQWVQYGDGDGAFTIAYASATSFTVASTDVTAVYEAGRRVKAVAATPGTIYGTIASVAFVTDTTVTVTWDSGSLSNEALTVYLGIVSATNSSLPVSSSTAKGAVELATTTETLTGTDAARAVTPDGLAALWEKGSDIASATTISIGEGGYFHVTGTTTITDIDFATDKAGRAAWLIFDGALTLTHNITTLSLPGSVNITTAAGDAALVVSEDGSDNVRVPVYFRRNGMPINGNASQADMEAATSTNTMVTPVGMQYHPGVAKAWVKVTNSGTPTNSASYNVSSLTDNGVGDFTVNFTTTFSSANYAYAGMPKSAAGGNHFGQNSATGPAAGSCRLLTQTQAVGSVDMDCAVAFYGDQ